MSGEQSAISIANSTKANALKYVRLNVGGALFYTTVATLTNPKHDTMLRAMFSGRMEVQTDAEGWTLIDRCGKHFGTVLNFLRDDRVPLPENKKELLELKAEAQYYCVQELVELVETQLKKSSEELEPICKVPLITSQREEQVLISSTTKPVIKLLINRHNNKYSYTNHSDDNLLKNMELFDKLSLRFNRRILFIKDVIGSQEICCWTFYGNGQKINEVCCTSIVYGTDKKHTKVEFPEARIYEETLNVLLYENHSPKPDLELINATSLRVTGSHSDDDGEASTSEQSQPQQQQSSGPLDRMSRLRRK